MPADRVSATVTINSERNGIEISFQSSPGRIITSELQAQGFRWHPKKKLWWAKRTDRRIEFAEKFKKGVNE